MFHKSVETLAKEHKILAGKWLYYHSGDVIDKTWKTIVEAIGLPEGVLRKVGGCEIAKVSAALEDNKPTNTICVYVNDSFNKGMVGTVLKTLVKDMKLIPSAYKVSSVSVELISPLLMPNLQTDAMVSSYSRTNSWHANEPGRRRF